MAFPFSRPFAQARRIPRAAARAITAPFRRAFVALRETGDYRYPATPRIPRISRTEAGVAITPDLALRNATVWGCTRYISQAVASLPVSVLAPGDVVTDSAPIAHAVAGLLGTRPSPEWSSFRFRETLTTWALLWGNGYAEIEFDMAGRAIGLWPIHPERVLPLRDDNGVLFYRVYNGAGYGRNPSWVDMPASNIFHLAGFGDGPVGINVVQYAAQSIGWSQAAELFGASFFGDGMAIGGVVTLKGRGDEDSLTRMRDQMEGRHAKGRGGRWFRWAFLDNGATLQKVNATPDEGQFVATLNFQVDQICRWFGVPASKVGQVTRTNAANAENLAIEVVTDAIVPWTTRWEQEASFKLFGQNRLGLSVLLDVKGLLRGDFASRQTGLQVMRQNGVISADDWAASEGMKQPGNANGGDKYLLLNIWTPMETVGDAPTPPPAPAKPAAPPGTEAQPGTSGEPGTTKPVKPEPDKDPEEDFAVTHLLSELDGLKEAGHAVV